MARLVSILLAALVVAGAFAAADSARAGRENAARTASTLEADIVRRINDIRIARGLRRVRWSGRLAAAGTSHSNDMARRGYFEHNSANGTSFWRRVERFYPSRGFRSWTVGENLYWGSGEYASAAWAVREWMDSPPHRATILSREWREIGLGAVAVTSAPGVYGGEAVTIVTADFGARS